jgi:DnaJ-class molecular chaperone
MPVSKLPGSKGDLVVKFEVDFPRRLDDSTKQQLRALLS